MRTSFEKVTDRIAGLCKAAAVFCTSAALFLDTAAPAHAGPPPAETESADSTAVAPEGYFYADSVAIRLASPLDSTLYGKNIFSIMPSRLSGDKADVKVHQSALIRDAMSAHIASNKARTPDGYRVRIFFDNRQTSRVESENTEKKFSSLYPGVPAYRSYANPYFKVTVGDFRSKSEAMQLLKSIVSEFPTAFVVKEKINYPAADRKHPTRTDTLKILKPLPESPENSGHTATRL